jgi:hypothetical protein
LLIAVAIGVVRSVATMATMAGAGIIPHFSDVPPGHPFFEEIQQVAGDCIANGYPDGPYKPDNPVSRQAMAAFLARTGSRVGASAPVGGGTPSHGSATPNVLSSWVNIAAGGIDLPDDGCRRTVKVEGHAAIFTVQTAAGTCHSTLTCNVELRLFVGSDQIASTFTRLNTDDAADSVSLTGLVETTDASVTYTLKWRTFNVKPSQARTTSRSVYGTFIPFATGYVPL